MATDVTTIEAVVRDDFALANDLDGSQFWTVVQQGAGQTIDLSTPSALKVTTGTTASAETIIRSRRDYGNPFRVMFLPYQAMLLSQRIANQEFELRVCTADGNEVASWLFDGTVATNAKMRSKNGGTVSPADSPVGIVDTSNQSASFELELFPDEVYWHNRQADNAGIRNQSFVRNRQVPNPDLRLFIEIRVRNLATAPVSSTTLQLDAVLIQDINEITAEITAGRGGGALSQSIPVSVLNNPTVNANGSSVTPRNVMGSVDPLSSTVLGVSGLFQQTAADTGTDVTIRPTRSRIVVLHQANQMHGYAILEQSTDNVNFRETARIPVPSDGLYHTFEAPIHYRYYRWKFQNGTTAQTSFWFSTLLVRGEGIVDVNKTLVFPLTAATGQALALSTTFNGPTIDLGSNNNWNLVRAAVKSDQASGANGIQIQHSPDGTNWLSVGAEQTSNAAGATATVEGKLYNRYVRLVYVNGAVAATNFYASLTLVSL